MVGVFCAPNGLGAGVEGDEAGALKFFTFYCLPYAFADVVVGGFGAPDGLGAESAEGFGAPGGLGAEGAEGGALNLFSCFL